MAIQKGRARIATSTITGTLQNPPFTVWADLTSGDATTTVVSGGDDSSTSFIRAGYAVSGTGVPGGATVLSVTSSGVFELSANATASGTNVELTITPTVASVVGRVVNPNITKGVALAISDTNASGVPDVKRWDGRNLKGTIGLELNTNSPIFPRPPGVITLSGFTDDDLNKTYTITDVPANYAKGAFVEYSCTVEWDIEVEGKL